MTTATSSSFTNFILAELRCVSIRASLFAAEAESIAVALRGEFVSPDVAVEWAQDIGLDPVCVSSASPMIAYAKGRQRA